MSCAICDTRKEKRFCPAVHGRICPQCCGEQREVTLDCPSECIYLQQAREHEKPRRMQDLDRASLFPDVEIPEQFLYDHEHLIGGLTYSLAKSARSNRNLVDADLTSALSAMTSSLETLVNSGLHYGNATPNPVQQAIMAELQNAIDKYREVEQQHLGYTRLRDSDVLRALVFVLRSAQLRTSGRPKSRALIDFVQRQFPESQSAIASPQETSRIVMP